MGQPALADEQVQSIIFLLHRQLGSFGLLHTPTLSQQDKTFLPWHMMSTEPSLSNYQASDKCIAQQHGAISWRMAVRISDPCLQHCTLRYPMDVQAEVQKRAILLQVQHDIAIFVQEIWSTELLNFANVFATAPRHWWCCCSITSCWWWSSSTFLYS